MRSRNRSFGDEMAVYALLKDVGVRTYLCRTPDAVGV